MEYKISEDQFQHCLECGDIISYGRKDKKFCTQKCKNTYHNKKSHDVRSLHHKIESRLNKNYEVLDKLLGLGITTMNLPDLIQLGFYPDYSTSYHKVHGHGEYRCYEIKYYKSETRVFNICRCVL